MGLEEDAGAKCFPARWSVAAKPCESCNSAAASLFCRLDSAFLCMGCDAKFHGTNKIASQHERIWMCEVCEQALASVRCKGDAATLCITCDRDIHSANPLARRHERSPVVPFYDTVETVVKSTATAFLVPPTADPNNMDSKICTCVADGQPHTSLIPSNNINLKHPAPEMKSMELLLSDSDQFLDFDYSKQQNHHNSGTDSVVPDQPMKPHPLDRMMDQSPDNLIEIDFTGSNLNCFNNSYTTQSLSQSVSSSSMDVGIVPDRSSISDTSYPFASQMNSNMDPNGSTNGNQASALSGMDREARVMRYREKRKNRKFEKRIRYVSRKAYAEMRPRIKGRFVKRTEAHAQVDHWFTSVSTAF